MPKEQKNNGDVRLTLTEKEYNDMSDAFYKMKSIVKAFRYSSASNFVESIENPMNGNDIDNICSVLSDNLRVFEKTLGK